MESFVPLCLVVLASPLILSTCSSVTPSPPPMVTMAALGEDSVHGMLGFEFLEAIPGQWHGPVATTTPAGSVDDWYVDLRPVSASQVGQYSTVDQDTVNYISFFVVEHEGMLERAHTEFFFEGDTLTMKTHTNRFNQVSPLELHSCWTATLGDRAGPVRGNGPPRLANLC
jgi:hypothetical protein